MCMDRGFQLSLVFFIHKEEGFLRNTQFNQSRHGMNSLGRNIEKRFNPALLVEGARSVMVFLAPYSLPHNLSPVEGMAQYALGDDYHKVIKDKLFAIMDHLKEVYPNFQGRAFTDSAPVMEREWGVRAGLGWIGKNNFLISKSCGIKNLIGVIISNLHIACDIRKRLYRNILSQLCIGMNISQRTNHI